jgi:lipid II:glycine glycyltransferase (peptidoglycan interpeptide bridge formation enzyme)
MNQKAPQSAFQVTVSPCPLQDLADAPVFLQTPLWGNFKARFGWEARGFRVLAEGEDFPLLVLLRRLRGGLVLAYVPHGPGGQAFLSTEVQPRLEERLEALAQALRPLLPRAVFTLRFDLLSGIREEITSGDEDTKDATFTPPSLGAPLRKPGADVQPPDTVLVDLTASEEEILARMKKKTRYNVRLAEKKGVRVREGSLADLEAWYALYRQTGERDKIALHPLAYYRTLLEEAASEEGENKTRVSLLLAELETPDRGTVLLAGNVVLTHAHQGVYLYGASANEYRNLMAPYLLQWEGMKWAKERGARVWDLFGIPPTNDTGHPMHGLYQFKTGWGGWIEHRNGAWDRTWKPWIWRGLNAVEKIRVWYFKVWKKR